MGRKKKYIDDDGLRGARQGTAELMWEIKEASTLTVGELAQALGPEIFLSEDLVRQYLAGKKVMGDVRQYDLARIAQKRGWGGDLVRKVLLWNEMLCPKQYREMMAELSSNDRKKRNADRKSALKHLEKGANMLLSQGMSDADLVGLMIMLGEKLVPADQLTHGGIINPAGLRACVGLDCGDYPDISWLDWYIQSLEEASKRKRAETEIR